jgi:hypothetical protein
MNSAIDKAPMRPVTSSPPAVSTEPSSCPASLMPSPSAEGDSAGGILLQMSALLLSHRSVETQERQAQVSVNQQNQDIEIKLQTQARIDEANAERKGGGFFGDVGMFVKHATKDALTLHPDKLVSDLNSDIVKDPQFWKDLESGGQEIGKWAAVAGSITLAGATLGAETPVAAVVTVLVVTGAAASTAGAAESDFHVLEKMGVDSTTAGWIGLGLSVGGALSSGGAGLAAAGGTASEASAFLRGLNTAGTVTDAGAGAADVVSGGASAVVAGYEKRAQLAQADEQAAEFNIQHLETRMQQILDALQQSYQTSATDLSSVTTAQTHNSQALMGLASMRA